MCSVSEHRATVMFVWQAKAERTMAGQVAQLEQERAQLQVWLALVSALCSL